MGAPRPSCLAGRKRRQQTIGRRQRRQGGWDGPRITSSPLPTAPPQNHLRLLVKNPDAVPLGALICVIMGQGVSFDPDEMISGDHACAKIRNWGEAGRKRGSLDSLLGFGHRSFLSEEGGFPLPQLTRPLPRKKSIHLPLVLDEPPQWRPKSLRLSEACIQ